MKALREPTTCEVADAIGRKFSPLNLVVHCGYFCLHWRHSNSSDTHLYSFHSGSEPPRESWHLKGLRDFRGHWIHFQLRNENNSTGRPLHMSLHIVNFQRGKHAFHQRQAWMEGQLVLRLLLLMILQLSHLPSPLPLLGCSLDGNPCMPVVVLTTVLFNVLYCKMKNVLFFEFVLCALFVRKYYKPIIVQYYIVDCISWVPRLTLLDLSTNGAYEHALRTELICN